MQTTMKSATTAQKATTNAVEGMNLIPVFPCYIA